MQILEKINLEIYGASHQKHLGFKLSGIPKGYDIDFSLIDALLVKRKGNSSYNTTRDKIEMYTFISGIENSVTTGETVHLDIEQSDFCSNDYIKGIVRPSHADVSAYLKFGDKYDYKGGGVFSGKMTVLYVIAGEIARQILEQLKYNIKGYGHISKVLDFMDDNINEKTSIQCEELETSNLPIFNKQMRLEVEQTLLELKEKKESLGAKLTFKFLNVPSGLGDIFLNSFESKLSALLFSVPAVKAVEFGLGTDFTQYHGSKVLESLEVKDEKIYSSTNFNGGINGGITNGFQPLVFSCTIKPTATL
ncbi:MAG: chorismate synthase, partial [Bacilli bacterium]